MNKKTKLRSESAIFILVLFGILLLVNLLSVRFFVRGDLTENNLFTLSPASTSVIEDLEDRLVVKAYFTKDLPGRYASLERQVRDLLEEYQQHSDGKMTVEFIDPDEDEDAEETAKNLGIHKVPNPDIEKDKATVKEGYRGLAFSYGHRNEAIRAVESPVGLEYEVTTILKKVIGHKSNVGFLIGHGEPMIDPPNEEERPLLPEEKLQRGAYRNIRANLEIYNYTQIDTKEGGVAIPSETQGLVIVGPTAKFTDKELYRIDQYLLSGKSVAMFLSGVNVRAKQPEMPVLPPTYEASVNRAGLRKFLSHHGVEFGEELVLDKQASNFVSKCPPLPIPMPRLYPAWPVVTAFGESSVTFRIGGLTFPYATPTRITEAAAKDKAKETAEIAFSSGSSWTVNGDEVDVDPCGIIESPNLQSGIPLAAQISGTFTSFFEGVELPIKPDSNNEFMDKSVAPGRLLVVGTAALPLDETLGYIHRIDRRMASNNFAFVQNVLDWMTNEDELIAVRMKNVNDPPLERGDDMSQAMAKWGNIIGIPIAFMLFGIIRWRIRASRRTQKGSKTPGKGDNNG